MCVCVCVCVRGARAVRCALGGGGWHPQARPGVSLARSAWRRPTASARDRHTSPTPAAHRRPQLLREVRCVCTGVAARGHAARCTPVGRGCTCARTAQPRREKVDNNNKRLSATQPFQKRLTTTTTTFLDHLFPKRGWAEGGLILDGKAFSRKAFSRKKVVVVVNLC